MIATWVDLGCEIPAMEAVNATGMNGLTRRMLPRLSYRPPTAG